MDNYNYTQTITETRRVISKKSCSLAKRKVHRRKSKKTDKSLHSDFTLMIDAEVRRMEKTKSVIQSMIDSL